MDITTANKTLMINSTPCWLPHVTANDTFCGESFSEFKLSCDGVSHYEIIDTEVVIDGTQKSVRLCSSAACVCTCGEKSTKSCG